MMQSVGDNKLARILFIVFLPLAFYACETTITVELDEEQLLAPICDDAEVRKAVCDQANEMCYHFGRGLGSGFAETITEQYCQAVRDGFQVIVESGDEYVAACQIGGGIIYDYCKGKVGNACWKGLGKVLRICDQRFPLPPIPPPGEISP